MLTPEGGWDKCPRASTGQPSLTQSLPGLLQRAGNNASTLFKVITPVVTFFFSDSNRNKNKNVFLKRNQAFSDIFHRCRENNPKSIRYHNRYPKYWLLFSCCDDATPEAAGGRKEGLFRLVVQTAGVHHGREAWRLLRTI